MENCIVKFHIFLLLLIAINKAIATNSNETLADDSRKPRVTGRIVKLYSGSKPVPILCIGEGFQADPHDCAVFYRCMKSGKGKYTVFRFQCGPETIYDPETEVCNHPQSTKRSECGRLKPPSINHDNANEIEGANPEIPSPITTKRPMHAEPTTTHETNLEISTEDKSPTTIYISHPATSSGLASTISSTYFSNPFITTTYQPHILHTTKFTVLPSTTTNNSKPNIQDKNNICTTDGFKGDTENCRKFYRCVANGGGRYIRYEFFCSESTIWDDDVQGCNHAWAVKRSRCSRNSQNAVEEVTSERLVEPDKTLTEQSQVSYGSEISEAQMQISNVFIIQNKTQINYGDRKNSNKSFNSDQKQTQISHSSVASPSQIQIDSESIRVQGNLQINNMNQSSLIPNPETTTRRSSSYSVNKESKMNKNSACTQSGFMGDSNDCKKFYRCIDNGKGGYTRYEFSCGEGTVWDPKLEACNHAWAVKECGGKVPSETTTQASYTNTFKTTQSYINTKPSEIYYPETDSMINNEEVGYGIQQHTTISSTTVVKTSSTENSIQEDMGYGNQIQQSTTIYPTTVTLTSTTAGSSGVGTECRASGFMGDKNDCKIFYRCVETTKGFTRYEFKCGEGTVWDPDIEACNHAWAVKKCGGNAILDINKLDSTTMKHTTLTSSTQNVAITTSSKPLVSENEDFDTGYGSPSNDFSLPSSTTKHPDSLISNMGNICKSTGFMGDENDCKRFYRCVDNGNGSFTRYEFTCGEGTVWDPEIEACNHAWAVKKCGKSATTDMNRLNSTTMKHTTLPTSFTQNVAISTTSKPLSIGNEDYDTGYVSQINNFNYPSSTTKKPQSLDTNIDNGCKTSGFIGDKKDCKRFYRCVNNGNGSFIRYEFICGEGTVWDPEIEACNHAWAVKKCGGIGPEIEHHETTIGPQISFTHEPQISGSVTDENENTGTVTFTYSTVHSTSTASQSSFTESSQCVQNGFIGDKQDCKKFYRCVDDGNGSYTRYDFFCGEGTVWDPKIEACNHVWAVEKCAANIEIADGSQASELPPSYPVMSDIHHDNYPPDEPYQGIAADSISQATITQSTTEVIIDSTDNSCKDSGFIGDKNNCKIFYRCVDDGKGSFIRYEFTCGEGALWDQSIEACNHDWAVKDCGNNSNNSVSIQSTTTATSMSINHTLSDLDGQGNLHHTEATDTVESNHENEINDICTNEGFIGDKNNCKKFYRCVDDGLGSFTKYEFTCGEGTYWNQDILSCDHAISGKYCEGKRNSSTTKVPEYAQDEMSTHTTAGFSSTMGIHDTSVGPGLTEKPLSSKVCNSEGFYGNPKDCKKFYRCVDDGKGGYTKYEFTCGDGTVWDQEIQSCNHESETDRCVSSHTNPPQSSTTQSVTSSSSSENSTEKTESSSATFNDQCASEGFFAHPQDCKKFIRCVSNDKAGYTRYDFSCGEGTIWVQDILACDHDHGDSNCSDQIHSTPKPQTTEGQHHVQEYETTHNSTSKPQTTVKLEDENYSESLSKPSKTGNCTSEGFYGNDEDCRRFYRCVDNGQGGYTKYDYTCGEGTAWDTEIQNCNHIDQVKKCHGTAQESYSPHPVMHDEENNQTTEAITTTSSTSKTTTSSNSHQDTGNNDSCMEEGYFGDTRDCKKFYRCVDDGKGGYTKFDFTCGEGTIWDQDVTTCNHPQDVTKPSCDQNQESSNTSTTTLSSSSPSSSTTQISSSSESTTQATSTGNSTTESTTQSSSNCSQEESSSKKPGNEHVNCTKEGYFPNPNDCKKYYRCVDWDGEGKRFSVYHFECGEGTIWDPALNTCNHEESVYPPRNCSGTQSQTDQQTTATEGTTTVKEETGSELSTTSQPSSEQTTTQSSTTEQSTTEQSTTSEQTTTQQSTSPEHTTTQQSTSSEQTTIEQSTTSERTTTPQSTTTKQTTTQQSTTSKQTTTQQSTTSEKTTTQQSTPSEQSTTEQSTTSEQTTTQQSTTSEQTTTQHSTTSEQTTQESTTSEQTTQESSTSEPTTTEQSSTSQQTTQESTTTEQTTQHTTTDQSTLESSTTDQSTSTTEQSSTEEVTTTNGTTEQTTTEQSTTEQSTTDSSTSGGDQAENSSQKECPETDEDQYMFVCPTSFRRHPKYCNMFYQCTEDDSHDVKIATFTCPNNTIYDESQIKCVEESEADKKCEGEIALRRRFKKLDIDSREPIIATNQSYACTSSGYFSFEKHSECSPAFLRCKMDKSKLRGYVYQCPTGYFFWSISKKCEPINKITDCKRSNNNWNDRWEIPVERRNVA